MKVACDQTMHSLPFKHHPGLFTRSRKKVIHFTRVVSACVCVCFQGATETGQKGGVQLTSLVYSSVARHNFSSVYFRV